MDRQIANERILAGKCPMPTCSGESSDIIYNDIECDDDGFIFQEAYCNLCYAEWKEYYKSKEIGDLEDGDGTYIALTESQGARPINDMFTQGNWTVTSRDFGHYVIKEVKERFEKLNKQTGQPTIQMEDEANIKLISAAPKLLKACLQARDNISELLDNFDLDFINLLDEAINQAGGI